MLTWFIFPATNYVRKFPHWHDPNHIYVKYLIAFEIYVDRKARALFLLGENRSNNFICQMRSGDQDVIISELVANLQREVAVACGDLCHN